MQCSFRRLHVAGLRVNGALVDANPLQDFAIETDALLFYDSVHYQDYSVNRAPIHRAFRAQAGAFEPSPFGTRASFFFSCRNGLTPSRAGSEYGSWP